VCEGKNPHTPAPGLSQCLGRRLPGHPSLPHHKNTEAFASWVFLVCVCECQCVKRKGRNAERSRVKEKRTPQTQTPKASSLTHTKSCAFAILSTLTRFLLQHTLFRGVSCSLVRNTTRGEEKRREQKIKQQHRH
jgi:hypothetical protein